jgi:hypothetical protein
MSVLSMEQSAPAPTARIRGERWSDRQFPKIVPDRRRYRRVQGVAIQFAELQDPDSLARTFG